jgi:hypothetical protein
MSFSNPRLENPAKKFLEWSSDEKCFLYYDKEALKKVYIQLPIYFITLDELSCVTGFNKAHKTNVFSNEVRSTTTEPLLVKTFKGGERIMGLYQEIKAEAKELGGKYTKSIYAMLIMPNQEPELVNIRLRGSANSAWIEKRISVDRYIICVKESSEETNGGTTYNVPIFSKINLTPEHRETAKLMDLALQEYLTEYFGQQKETLAAIEEVDEQPAHIAEMDAKLKSVISNTTRPANALLDKGWVKEGRKLAEKVLPEGPISDPGLLDDPNNPILNEGVDDLPF